MWRMINLMAFSLSCVAAEEKPNGRTFSSETSNFQHLVYEDIIEILLCKIMTI